MNQHDKRGLIKALQDAEDSEFGIELTFLDADSARQYRQHLYKIRKEMPEFSHISLSQTESILWLLKGPDEDAED